MKYPIRNMIYEKMKQAGNMMDSDLVNTLTKDIMHLNEYGLIRVSWVTKDKRRIEAVVDYQQ